MKKSLLALGLLCGGLLLAGGNASAESVKVPVNTISVEGVGLEIGYVTFVDTKVGMDVLVDLMGLPEGEHGMHVHENPACAAVEKDGVKVAGLAAGGHYDPAKAGKHMGPGKEGHKGDLPKLVADAKGVAKAKLMVEHLSTKDIKGRALMIHAGGDNYSDTPPLGGGGARIACGVIN